MLCSKRRGYISFRCVASELIASAGRLPELASKAVTMTSSSIFTSKSCSRAMGPFYLPPYWCVLFCSFSDPVLKVHSLLCGSHIDISPRQFSIDNWTAWNATVTGGAFDSGVGTGTSSSEMCGAAGLGRMIPSALPTDSETPEKVGESTSPCVHTLSASSTLHPLRTVHDWS